MESMGNGNLNLSNELSDFISNEENEEMRFFSTIRTDAKFNGFNEEYSRDTGFHHSQFPDPSVSFGSFSDSISYTDIDWSFDGSRSGRTSQNWSHSISKNFKNETNASLHVRSTELAINCRVPVRSQESESVHIIGCDRETNNHNLQSSGCEDQIDLNITASRCGLQPHCSEELNSETLDVRCHTKATMALNKTDKISGFSFKDNSGDIPNLMAFSENFVDVKQHSNLIDFSLQPSSIIISEDNHFPTRSNEDDLSSAAVEGNDDIHTSFKIAAPSMSATSDSQIGLSSQSWFPDLESCLLRRDQNHQPTEQKSHTPSLGIPATISAPDQSFELDRSTGTSQPQQNIGNTLTSGNQDAREHGTVEDSDHAKSYPNSSVFVSSVPVDGDMLFEAHIAQFLSSSVSPRKPPHDLIQSPKTKIDLNLQKQEQVSQSIISEGHPFVSSKFEDIRARSFQRSRTSSDYIKCQDFDETFELSGEICYLCKSDLSFKPKGSVSLRNMLPPVAVLPCGHVFHDHCLELITPQKQAEDPPCIPCALGES